MRVTAALRRRFSDESGISALMVGVSVIALFGSASVAVDLGNLWSSRRHVITSADAAALAAASEFAVGGAGCSKAASYVTANDSDGSLLQCAPSGHRAAGFVQVETETPVDYAFAGVLGFEDRDVTARTAAAWGIPAAVKGLRPFGLCKDDPAFQAWVANPRGESATARVFYTNAPTDCGGAPGNWGIIDLDNVTPVSESDVQAWVRFGYPGSVRPGNIGGSPGAFGNNLDDDLAVVAGKRFPIPIFDRVNLNGGGGGKGGGANATFHVVGFVEIRLMGWRTTGSEPTRYLDVRFAEMVTAGECCDPAAPDWGLRVVRICDVDPDFDPANCSASP